MCVIIFFRSSVSATKMSYEGFTYRNEIVLYVLVKLKPNYQTELFSDRQSTAERMCVFGRSRKAEMLSRTR